MTKSLRTLDDIFAQVVINNAIMVTHDDNQYVTLWAECYNSSEIGTGFIPESYLTVTDLGGNRIDDFELEKTVKLKAMAFRVEQIQADAGITGEVRDLETITPLLDRVWAGEWMGQFNEGKNIYFEEVASLLNLTFSEVLPIVNRLVETRLADVLPSSWILVAPLGEEILKSTMEAYGHKEYRSSDFGWWSCSACEQNGDDYSSATDFTCL